MISSSIARLGYKIAARYLGPWLNRPTITWVSGSRFRTSGILLLLLVRGMLVSGVLLRPILRILVAATMKSSIRF